MTNPLYKTALIVGAGTGISASLTRLLVSNGIKVAIASRDASRLAPLVKETGASAFSADATSIDSVARLFEQVDATLGEPDIVVYNAGSRAHGPVAELNPEAVRQVVEVTAFGAFLVTQQAARRMLKMGKGAILLTGASASVKGFAMSSAFAMGKFALRGLAQSAARELGPKGIHVAHFIVDGGVRSASHPDPAERPDSSLSPDAIARNYINVLNQSRDAWSFEVDMRPWVETF
jgi:NAD(P)-dependent dehydrogenase (short-subunit alcohol dehydrogenase family)